MTRLHRSLLNSLVLAAALEFAAAAVSTAAAYYKVTQSPSDSNACEREFLRCSYWLYIAIGLLGLISAAAGIVYRFREKIWQFRARAARAAVRPVVNTAAAEDEHSRTVITVYPNQAFSAHQNFGAAAYGNANSYPLAYPPQVAQMSEPPPLPFTAYPPPPYPSAPPPYPDESALYQNVPPPHPDGFTSYPPAYPAQVPPKYG